MLAVPNAPPLANSDYSDVRRWAEQAAGGLASRREGLKLVRQIERVLAEEHRTARQISCTEERIERRRLDRERRGVLRAQRRRRAGRAEQDRRREHGPTGASVCVVRRGAHAASS